MMRPNDDKQVVLRRVEILQTSGLFIIGLLLLGFWYYQVLHGSYYRELSENNRLKTQIIYAPRGLMRDCDQRILAGNHPSFDLELVREEVTTSLDDLLSTVSGVLGLPKEELDERMESYSGLPSFRPIVLKENLKPAEVSHFVARQELYTGLQVRRKNLRRYWYGPLAAHLMGYVGEVTEEQVVASRQTHRPYQPGDLIGKSGLEKHYNNTLQGRNGLKEMVVNSHGREVKEHSHALPVHGGDMQLTIDFDLQEAAEKAMVDQTGAAVFLDVHTGRILALVSRPTFNPNDFTVRLTRSFWHSLISNPEHPMQNRVIQSKYAPGSVFKIIMAAAALEESVIGPGTVHNCPGYARIYKHTFRCWKGGGHGTVALEEAIRRSCNVYFYKVGAALGIEKIHLWADRFGLGQQTGIDLGPESAGTLPSEEWKRERFNQPWYPGETISVAIGQGYLEVTPIQLAVFMAAVANGGTRYRPQIVTEIQPRVGQGRSRQFEPEELGNLGLHDSTLRVLRRAMWSVVNVKGGTARKARVEGFDVCGKTGTAQIHKSSVGVKPKHLPRELRDHAWFAGFAPQDDPSIAFCVFIEHGGHGGDTAAPVVQQVVSAYHNKYFPGRAGDAESVVAMNR